MSRKLDIEFSVKQSQAYRFLSQNEKAVELLYGGAKFGGKSWFGCDFCYLEAIRLIRAYEIGRKAYPITVGFMGRKTGANFFDTTFETWKQAIPVNCYQLKGNPPEIIIEGRVKILTGGLDRTRIETDSKFNSAAFGFYFVDQAEETDNDDTMFLRAATFWRLILNGKTVPGKGLLTANPAQCWLKEEFEVSKMA